MYLTAEFFPGISSKWIRFTVFFPKKFEITGRKTFLVSWTGKFILTNVWIRLSFGLAGVQLVRPGTLGLTYRMIICSIITCGSIVWWTRVRLDTAERELSKLQWKICIAMSACIRTTPKSSLELLLGPPPAFFRCILRLRPLYVWRALSI